MKSTATIIRRIFVFRPSRMSCMSRQWKNYRMHHRIDRKRVDIHLPARVNWGGGWQDQVGGQVYRCTAGIGGCAEVNVAGGNGFIMVILKEEVSREILRERFVDDIPE